MGSKALSKVGDIAVVFDGPHATPKKLNEGPYFLSISSLESGKLDLEKSAHLSEEQFTKWTRRVTPEAGDVLFSYETRLGEAALMPSGVKACLGRRMGLLRPDRTKILPEYLLYAYLSPDFQQEIKKRTIHGATVERIALKELPDFEIRVPTILEQKNTTRILTSIDNKIELNRQTNETLEKMAQALFKSWFVDFDPVIDNALEAGNTIPDELQDRAERRQQQLAKPDHQPLPDAIRQLFPSEFELTEELGWVPMGWKVSAISKMIDINPRISLPKGTIAKFADMKALPTSGYSIENVIEKTYSGGVKFQNGDVLLARITPCLENGKTGVVDFLNGGEAGFGSTEFITMRKKGAIETSFVACLARDENFRKHCMQSMVGSSGRQRVQNACFDAYYMSVPDLEELLILFSKMTSINFSKMSINSSESQALTSLRDTLLPKLISGELQLSPEAPPDAEQQLADATS